MTSNLKLFSVLGAILALGIAFAAMASADKLEFESSNKITGTTESGTSSVIKTTSGNISCHLDYKPGFLFFFKVDYTKCIALGFTQTEVEMNECEYHYNVSATGGVTTGTTDITCPAGKEITFTVRSAGTLKCTIHIPPQTSLSGVTYSNVGTGSTREVTVDTHITNLKYSHTSTGATGLGQCFAGSASNGVVESKVLLTGENSSGSHVPVFLF
jgi:hypothetical protein